jgi:hypothetical protein
VDGDWPVALAAPCSRRDGAHVPHDTRGRAAAATVPGGGSESALRMVRAYLGLGEPAKAAHSAAQAVGQRRDLAQAEPVAFNADLAYPMPSAFASNTRAGTSGRRWTVPSLARAC